VGHFDKIDLGVTSADNENVSSQSMHRSADQLGEQALDGLQVRRTGL
jgi:hypothetical protein